MHWLQRHWYRLSPLHSILLPLSLSFHLLAIVRRALYRSNLLHSTRLSVPVVIVGNISVGGTGKTPLTLALARQLIERGRTPLIISRGHGGSNEHPRAVMPDGDASEVGDEPLLMARRGLCPVWIGRDRAATAQAALAANPRCDVVLCDDGLQHYRLQRDVEIAVVDSDRRFGNGFMLPAGPLREPVSRLRTVDAVVVNGNKDFSAAHTMHLEGELFYNLRDGRTVDASYFAALRNHAVAGIGNPQRFFRHLEALGLHFTPHAYPDHHPFAAGELDFPGCDAIFMTEKDAVKCTAFADGRYWTLCVEARFDPSLTDLILRKITAHGPEAA